MFKKIEKLIIQNRSTLSSYHFKVAREWRILGQENKLHTPLSYSSFEYRMAIERFLFEFYFIMKGIDKFKKGDEKEASSIPKLISAIYKLTGKKEVFKKKLLFNRIIGEEVGLKGKDLPAYFDIDILISYWNKLSNYCHKQLSPKKTWDLMGNEWVISGYNLLDKVDDYLWNNMLINSIGWLREESLCEEQYIALCDFINGKINEEILRIRIQLMLPILKRRDLYK